MNLCSFTCILWNYVHNLGHINISPCTQDMCGPVLLWLQSSDLLLELSSSQLPFLHSSVETGSSAAHEPWPSLKQIDITCLIYRHTYIPLTVSVMIVFFLIWDWDCHSGLKQHGHMKMTAIYIFVWNIHKYNYRIHSQMLNDARKATYFYY